ncbi:MAG: hypothetical protein ACT4R6_00020 [Gemmatimonadaceae bacterium]
MIYRIALLAAAIPLAALACASGGGGGGGAETSTAAQAASNTPRRGNSTLLTESEIAAAGLETLYDVIERLRPNMLRTRGQIGRISGASAGDPGVQASSIRVYLNGTPVGDISYLRSIQAASVREVRLLNSSDATTRFGTGHDAGALLITSK